MLFLRYGAIFKIKLDVLLELWKGFANVNYWWLFLECYMMCCLCDLFRDLISGAVCDELANKVNIDVSFED